MRIALFGGTFDPIHCGHLQAAEEAAHKFRLDQVLFVPTGNPPHKHVPELTPFAHRFAMVALACAGVNYFLPSLLEAPTPDGQPHYSIATARKARTLFGRGTKVTFLIGADSFLDLPHWKNYRQLLDLVDFIVVSRPGFDDRAIAQVLPRELVKRGRGEAGEGTLRLRRSTVSFLRGVDAPVASRDIREAIRAGRQVAGLVPPLVEHYIYRAGLYRTPEARQPRR